MREIRREINFDDGYFAITIDEEIITFHQFRHYGHTQLLYNVEDLNSKFLVDFTLNSFIEAVSLQEDYDFMWMMERLFDNYNNLTSFKELQIEFFELFAKLYSFNDDALDDVDSGYSLGEVEDEGLMTLQLKCPLYGMKYFVFKTEFYNNLFSTKINQPFTPQILNKIENLELYWKFVYYFIKNDFEREDTPSIKNTLNRVTRKSKIKSILDI